MVFNAKKLTDLRWQKHLKQIELAALIGVKSPVICSWERGKYTPRADMLMKLAQALEVPPEYFFD